MTRQRGGKRRSATATVAVTGSPTVTRAISEAGFGGDLAAGGDGSQRDHLHRVIAEPDALEGNAVDGAVVLADSAVGAAVVVDEDLAGLAAKLLTEYGVANFDETTARRVTVLPVDDDVQRLLRADVVARATQDAGRLVDVVHRVALEAAQGRRDGLLVFPGQLDRRHVPPLVSGKDGRLLTVVVIGLAVIVGRLDNRQRFGVARHRGAQQLVDRARGPVTPGDRIDDERRPLNAVPAGKQLCQLRVSTGVRLHQLPRRKRHPLILGKVHDLT